MGLKDKLATKFLQACAHGHHGGRIAQVLSESRRCSTVRLGSNYLLQSRSLYNAVPSSSLPSSHMSSSCCYSTATGDPASSSVSAPLHTPSSPAENPHSKPRHYCPHCGDHSHSFSSCRFDWKARSSSRVSPRRKHKHRSNYRGPKRVPPPHENIREGEMFYEEIQAYQDHFLPLIDAEQLEDEAILENRLTNWSVDRLKQEGYCITDMSAFWLETSQFGRPVASFALGPGIPLPDHRFEKGTQVLVTRLDPLREDPRRGSVVDYTDSQLRICFQDTFVIDEGTWRLDVGRSSIVFDRMRAAVGQLNYDPARQDVETGFGESDRQVILQGTHLRDVLLRSFGPSLAPEYEETTSLQEDSSTLSSTHSWQGVFKNDMHIQSWATRYSKENPVVIEGDPVLNYLNPTQIRAVAMMLDNRFALVQGPPGTGKTKTIIEAVRLLKTHFEVSYPILLCTYTNVAVDNLVEGLVAAGLNPLRVGFGGKVKESLRETTLIFKMNQHPLNVDIERVNSQIESIRKRKKDLSERIDHLRDKNKTSYGRRLDAMESDMILMERQLGALKAKAYAIHQEMLRDVVYNADVVCTTCITSASVSLNVQDFPIVFIDEASMSTEPASLIPLMKGSQHVALIGDHKQLPPVITSPEAQAKGFGVSMFERLAEEGLVPSIMLDVQYRMHPTISHFPSTEFYSQTLKDGTVNASGEISSHLQPPSHSLPITNPMATHRPSVVFLDHSGSESMKDRSRVNINEAHIVCSLVEDILLHNESMRGADIGVIAPYVAQITLLNRLLRSDAKYKQRFEEVLGSQRAMQLSEIEVKTVDGFEGREKDVIIFSTVRNNASGHIGFLADRRRLNVGLTRAKRGLYVIGNIETLRAGRTGKGAVDALSTVVKAGKGAQAWKRYAEFLGQENLILRLSGENLRKVLYGNRVS